MTCGQRIRQHGNNKQYSLCVKDATHLQRGRKTKSNNNNPLSLLTTPLHRRRSWITTTTATGSRSRSRSTALFTSRQRRIIRRTSGGRGEGGGRRRVFGVDVEPVVQDDEEHGARAEEDGELVEFVIRDHGCGGRRLISVDFVDFVDFLRFASLRFEVRTGWLAVDVG